MSTQRITELETKLAFMEATVAQLSDQLYHQQQTVEELRTWCRTLAQRVSSMDGDDAAQVRDHEPPPHY